ncbi:MAG: GNAT family N-acetyltransferase [Oscillospiraceae bacterium]|jgi:predicted N-acetyltransferase YhbS|nr:GNAT family N-acetyltransferase [Oscillospiraceae bacterium]
MGNLLIRKAELHDCAGIQNIHRNCDDPWHDQEECAAWVSKRLERGFYIQIAEIDGKTVGHGEWVVTIDPRDTFLCLGMLQMDEDFQGRGIGRKMIEDGIRMAKEQDCHKIVTIPETGSEGFYMKCGFVNGRLIKSVTLQTSDCGYSKQYTAIESAPFSIIQKSLFIFGLAQASSRHMWEAYNQKPATDDRMSAAILSDDGDCIQLGWFAGSDTALALYWGNSPGHCVSDILTFGNRLGLQKIAFLFYEDYQFLFDGSDLEIHTEHVEIYKTL